MSVNVAVNVFNSDVGLYLAEEKEAQSKEQFIADIGNFLDKHFLLRFNFVVLN